MIIKLTEQQLHYILNSPKSFVNETLGKTYRGDLYSALGKEWIPNRTHNSFFEKVEQLGYKHILTASEYDGNYTESVRKYKTTLANYNNTKQQLQSLLNFYGYSIIQQDGGVSSETGEDMKWLTFETNYDEEFDYANDPIFYHAAPTSSVNKILQQGLVPKDRNKLGLSRPNRIYLLRTYDDNYFRNLNRKEGQFSGGDWDYTVLKIDLSGMKGKIHLYQDPYSDDGKAFYTADNIPPSCITVPTQVKQTLLNDRETVAKIIESLYPFLEVIKSDFRPDTITVKGTYENPSTMITTLFDFTVIVNHNDNNNSFECFLKGYKKRIFPSKRVTIKSVSNNQYNYETFYGDKELAKFLKSFIGTEMKQKKTIR